MIETNAKKVAARLKREGWTTKGGGRHDIYRHREKPGRIVVPRHKDISINVARSIAKLAGWTAEKKP